MTTVDQGDSADTADGEVRPEDLLVAGLCLLVALVVAAESLPRYAGRQGLGPGAFPSWIALFLAVCSAIVIGKALRERRLSPALAWPRGAGLRRILLAVGSMALYLLTLPWLGFTLPSVAFLLIQFRLLGSYSWRVSLPLAIGSALLVWYVFGALLLLPLPTGLVGL